MEKIILRASDVAFWGALGLSLINVFAGLFGFPQAVNWLLGTNIPAILLVPCALLLWGTMIYSWLSALLGNSSGMLIYAANVLTSPFFYQSLGLPYAIGFVIAVFPYPFYFGLHLIIDQIEAKLRR